jgi:hypothetical protein
VCGKLARGGRAHGRKVVQRTTKGGCPYTPTQEETRGDYDTVVCTQAPDWRRKLTVTWDLGPGRK